MVNLVIPPTTLSIITTYQCTSACKNCCFQSNPSRKEMLSVEDIKKYITDTTQAYPSLKILVLTGGECFIYGDKLEDIIRHAKSCNLPTRIVSNGFWAKTYEIAYQKLSKLVEAGLMEINFSTGDDHLEYVSVEYIKNGVLASMKCGLTAVVNVESAHDREFESSFFTTDSELAKYIESGQLKIINGIWMPFTQTTANKMKESKAKKEKGEFCAKDRGCEAMFNTITIDPNHRVIACCGLTSKQIKYLDLGDISKYPIKELYDKQFNDFLKIWIATDGPIAIMDFISKFIPINIDYRQQHSCLVCEKIFNTTQYLDILQNNYKERYLNTIIKHMFNQKQFNYEKTQ